MKALFAAAAVALAIGAAASAAHADGPRASSEHNWPGMTNPSGTVGQYPIYQYQATTGVAPRYVWQEGYDHHGRWNGHWVLVQ